MAQIAFDSLSPNLKGSKFRAVTLANIENGEIVGAAILIRVGRKWHYSGDSAGPWRYDTLKAAQDDCRRLKDWAEA